MAKEDTAPLLPEERPGGLGQPRAAHQHRLSLGLLMLLLVTLSRGSRYTRTSLAIFGPAAGVARFSSFDIDFSKLLVGVAFAVLALSVLRYPRQRIARADLPLAVLVVFGVLGIVSLVWAYDPAFSLAPALRFFQYVIIYWMVICFTSSGHDLHHWGHAFLYAAFPVLAGCIQERVSPAMGLGGVAGGQTRVYWTVYPCWALLSVPFAFHYLFWARNRAERLLSAGAVVASLLTIYLSARRAAALGLAVVVLVYLLAVGRHVRGYRWFVAVLLGCGALAVVLDPRYAARLSTLSFLASDAREYWEAGMGAVRATIYLMGVEMFLAHPILGLGPSGEMLWTREVIGRPYAQHNLFLQIGVETGAIGLAVYGLFLLIITVALRRTMRSLLAMGDVRMASLVAALFTSFVVAVFYAQFHPLVRQMPIYLCAALGAAACHLVAKGSWPYPPRARR